MKEWFRKFSSKVAEAVGTPLAFGLAISTIVVWGLTGPMFHYSDTWQLIINTGTTIITFLMVFLIQNAQNRDSRMLHLKIGELIRAIHGARNDMINLEEMSDEQIEKLHSEYKCLHEELHAHVTKRGLKGGSKAAAPKPAAKTKT